MSKDYVESEFSVEVRDTIVKSSLTGVAATVLAVAVSSPAGLGGMIGTSLASGFGASSTTQAAENPYANLPAYPAPLTAEEVSDIRGQLAATAAALEITRAATEAKIDYIRSIAAAGPASLSLNDAPVTPSLRTELSQAEAPEPVQPVSFVGGDMGVRDPHLELAALLLAHENF